MSFATIATIALVASASLVSAAPVAVRDKPSTWADGYLEDYSVYHARYIAIGCKTQHNTTFFDACCHPLLADQTVTTYCSANATESASVASSIAEFASTATASASATADVEAASAYSSASESIDEAASTASYSWATESSSTATASATATLDAAAEWAHKTSSSSKGHGHTSSTEEQSSATSTSSSAASATSTSSSSGTVYTGGYATFFYQDGNAGECGTVHSDSDYIIAIDANGWWSDYESNDNSPYCGKYITITNTDNQKSVTAMVADVCPTCVSNNSLDLSVGAFTAIASESDGEIPITWVWA